MHMEIIIAKANQANDILKLYTHYVKNSVATFEEQTPSLIEMKQRIHDVGLNHLWLCLYHQGEMLGYCYAGAHRARSAYRFSVESSIYLSEAAQGRGLAKPFYGFLLSTMKEMGYHTAFAGISLPNTASVKLHSGLGFQTIGTFKGVGFKFNHWIDTFWMSLRLRDDAEIPKSTKRKEELFLSEDWQNKQKNTENMLLENWNSSNLGA